jgi:hypothetical protein
VDQLESRTKKVGAVEIGRCHQQSSSFEKSFSCTSPKEQARQQQVMGKIHFVSDVRLACIFKLLSGPFLDQAAKRVRLAF